MSRASATCQLFRAPAAAVRITSSSSIHRGNRFLGNHPLVGRPAERGMRELVISRGRSGSIALYGYEEAEDRLLVAAIRDQREAGYDPRKR